MPTKPDSPAAASARKEAERWMELADWEPDGWEDVPPTEVAVVRFFDPSEDLGRRAAKWNHDLTDHRFASLAEFGAGLAVAEAEAWERNEPHIATRAYADRRFLLGDRILHWAMPYFDSVGRCYPEYRDVAHRQRDRLLALGERHRPAPDLIAGEGLAPPGEDAYGPLTVDAPLEDQLRSLWSGLVILDSTVESMDPVNGELLRDDEEARADVAMLFHVAAARWRSVAASHPGSARLWMDLAMRAIRTQAHLTSAVAGEANRP